VSRLAARFSELKSNARTALIPYVMSGDPSPEITLPLMHAMVEAGADIIELGAPFSDPMADGPVIQARQKVTDAQYQFARCVLRRNRVSQER